MKQDKESLYWYAAKMFFLLIALMLFAIFVPLPFVFFGAFFDAISGHESGASLLSFCGLLCVFVLAITATIFEFVRRRLPK